MIPTKTTALLTVLCLSASLTLAAEAPGTGSAAQPAGDPRFAPMDKAAIERRLESVKTLLERSSAAKQIEQSNDPSARAQRDEALKIWAQAKEAFDQGNLERTQKLLVEAPKLMFKAARAAAPEQVVGEKLKSDYENRRDSVKELLAAQIRINKEKGNNAEVAKSSAEIERLIAESEALAKEGKYGPARATADKAYLIAQTAIGSMRSGDTLVRSLNFASKEEEFKYETDRNDTHQMLLKVLAEQKSSNPMIDKFVAESESLRVQAEKAAASGDHVEGIRLMEESTAQLVRAIRASGIYIPG
jgi:hypothetical protein